MVRIVQVPKPMVQPTLPVCLVPAWLFFFRDFQARSVREAMFSLDQNIMAIQHHARNQAAPLYNTCILPIFLYGTETWSVTVTLSRTIDALDNWCLRRILNIHWSEFVTNDEIRSCTGQPEPFLSDSVRSRRLFFIGHLYRADHGQDHHQAPHACIAGPPDNWRRRIGRPGSELWRPTCNLWILDWWLRNDALRIDRLGGNSWQRLRLLRHTPEEERAAIFSGWKERTDLAESNGRLSTVGSPHGIWDNLQTQHQSTGQLSTARSYSRWGCTPKLLCTYQNGIFH